jgi:hypothetical protein
MQILEGKKYWNDLPKWGTMAWIFIVSASCLGVAFWSVVHPTLQWQTLLLFVAAGSLPLMVFASEIMITKDGVHIKGIWVAAKKAIEEMGIGRVPDGHTPDGGDDPQKGKWGGSDFQENIRLTAAVVPLPGTPDWFSVRLVVGGPGANRSDISLVRFHLHPSFKVIEPMVKFRNGKAVLELVAWGGFTVGAEVLNHDGDTVSRLELDLATLPDAPDLFVGR